MFNFTTQTIYNQISTSGANKNMWVATSPNKPALRIGNTRFDANDILDIQVKNPTVENLASVTFEPAAVKPNAGKTTGRIVLYINLSMNCQDSFYANDLVYKGKPLFIEFPVSSDDTDAAIAARVKSIADNYLLFQAQEKILDVQVDGTEVTFCGVNGYQIISKAVLQQFDPEAIPVDCCTNQGAFVDKVVGVPVIYTTDADGVVTLTETKMGEDGTPEALAANEVAIAPGIEAFGDYNWIIHNLRLPTAANTNFWSPTSHMGELPAVGQVYTQFIIRICKERDGIMGEIVGARGKSVTTHVLYVAGKVGTGGSAAKQVNDVLFGSGTGQLNLSSKKKTDADTKLVAPFS